MGQPPPPVNTELVPDKIDEGVDRHGDDNQTQAKLDRTPEAFTIARRQRRGELAGLLIEQHGKLGLTEQQDNEQAEQAPRLPFFTLTPVRRRNVPEALPHLAVKFFHGLQYGQSATRRWAKTGASWLSQTRLNRCGGMCASTPRQPEREKTIQLTNLLIVAIHGSGSFGANKWRLICPWEQSY